jgi:DNA-binding NtrC family response regulator
MRFDSRLLSVFELFRSAAETGREKAGNKGETTMQLTEKYRPATWSDVVGQDKIVGRIRQLAQRGLAGRAYWITGQSGTGKTTIAPPHPRRTWRANGTPKRLTPAP